MVTKIYYNKKFIHKYKNSKFKNIKINIVDYYGIIKEFTGKKELDKYIIKNSRDNNISTQKVKYIKLKENIYYLYITKFTNKYRYSLLFDYTIPLNYLLWSTLKNNTDEFITFSGNQNNIVFQKSSSSYIYGIYIDEPIGEKINLETFFEKESITNTIKGLERELKW
ncbi:hypothetical protein X275_00530 [Marinitoga sp. 1197]|uniref:hypothetical protein n=1 Tax=Marinitoga sp. 1197 TaxID=1428449 RepID=UPI0006412930|nr:hypothetical protein [Marinitoga sp. 1197]KLO24316.1 hypothetical protein X275_00530 [Marinitoga sp. 1197]